MAITTDLLSPANTAELARVKVSADDCERVVIDNIRIGSGT